jgi:hypothetical protein
MNMRETECQQLDRILEAAVIVSWPELIADSASRSVHVEYDFGPNGEIAFLRIWSSETAGIWHLVCSCCRPTSGSRNSWVQFENGYTSERLAETLNFAMHHQDIFRPLPNLGRQGSLQIANPSEKERTNAVALIREAFDAVGSGFAEPVLV